MESDARALAKQQRREKIRAALARFGFSSLRGLQGPALRSVLAKSDTLVLMPTGGGKSLCYQLPALLLPGVVVVVCPLLALMQDQVMALRRLQIRVEMLSSLVTDKQRNAIYEQLLAQSKKPDDATNRIELLYTTPETLSTQAVQSVLKQLYERDALALFAVDEAHCISSWGHDFRPAYRGLGALRRSFPKVPFMALTATATQDVRADIQRQLQLSSSANVLLGDFNRANISYSVCDKETLADPMGALARFIQKHHQGQSGVIYVHKRTDTDELVEKLSELDPSLRIAAFHSKIPQKEREMTLHQWLKGKIHVICATIAFGMGIDHASVRFVVHWNMPKTLENLYQEAGRAGRDGQPSNSVIMYSSRDYDLFRFLVEKDNEAKRDAASKEERERLKKKQKYSIELLDQVQRFATKKECRRQAILRYFGQQITVAECAGTCDVCNPRLKFFRFEPEPIEVDDAGSGFMKAGGFMKASQFVSSQDLDGRDGSSRGKREKSVDARRNNLLFQRAGAYAPDETKSLVVRGGNNRALASEGFVAVNGEALSDDEDTGRDCGSGFRSAAEVMAETVGRGTKRASMESRLEALERAERAMQSDEEEVSKKQKIPVRNKTLGIRSRLMTKISR